MACTNLRCCTAAQTHGEGKPTVPMVLTSLGGTVRCFSFATPSDERACWAGASLSSWCHWQFFGHAGFAGKVCSCGCRLLLRYQRRDWNCQLRLKLPAETGTASCSAIRCSAMLRTQRPRRHDPCSKQTVTLAGAPRNCHAGNWGFGTAPNTYTTEATRLHGAHPRCVAPAPLLHPRAQSRARREHLWRDAIEGSG